MLKILLMISLLISFNPLSILAKNNQNKFCLINKKFSDLSKKTNKELKLQLFKRKRKNELSNLNFEFKNWNGKIETIDSVGDEYAYVSIIVCKNVTIKTWNNEFSDIIDKTLIHIDSNIYEILLDLETGDSLIISGSFIKSESDYFQESSITNSGSLSEPEYIVNFSRIFKK